MFLASRILLLILVIIAALVCVELFVFGAVTAGVAVSAHRASLTDFIAFAGSLLIGVLIAIALKYVFRPPAIRSRYWAVFIALVLIVGSGLFLLLR